MGELLLLVPVSALMLAGAVVIGSALARAMEA